MFKKYLYRYVKDFSYLCIENGQSAAKQLIELKVHRLSPVVGEYIYKVINYKWKW